MNSKRQGKDEFFKDQRKDVEPILKEQRKDAKEFLKIEETCTSMLQLRKRRRCDDAAL